MSTFIHVIQGRISAINYGKKELSLSIKEIVGGKAVEKNIDFSLDPNVIIANSQNQQIKLMALIKGYEAEIGYARNKARRAALNIKVIR